MGQKDSRKFVTILKMGYLVTSFDTDNCCLPNLQI